MVKANFIAGADGSDFRKELNFLIFTRVDCTMFIDRKLKFFRCASVFLLGDE